MRIKHGRPKEIAWNVDFAKDNARFIFVLQNEHGPRKLHEHIGSVALMLLNVDF